MLADEIAKAQKDGKAIESAIAPCRYCGQGINIRKLPEWSKKKEIEMATQTCGCEKAAEYTSRLKSIENIDEAVRKLFGAESGRNIDDDTASLIRKLAMEVLAMQLKSVSIVIPETSMRPEEKLTIKLKKAILTIKIEHKEEDVILA